MDLVQSSWASTSQNEVVTIGSESTLANTTTPHATYFEYNEKRNIYDTEVLFEDYSTELLTFAWVSCILFIAIGIPGNLITIMALYKSKKTRNATAIFIINLAISDLLFCCFNLPLAASTFHQRSWHHGELLCRLFPLLRYGLLAVSLLTILSITINRYIMIGHPRKYLRIYRRRSLIIMIVGIWLGSFSILFPTWHGSWGRFGLDISIGSCSIIPDQYGRSPKKFLFVIAFIVPCFCIVACYARIFYIVRRAAIRCREPELSNSLMPIDKSLQINPLQNANNDKNEASEQNENSEISSDLPSSFIERHMMPFPGTRPLLSILKEGEMKFIDTSVESDNAISFSVPEKKNKEYRSPDHLMYDVEGLKRENDTMFDIKTTIQEVADDLFDNLDSNKATETESENIERRKRYLKNSLPTPLNHSKQRKFQHTSTLNTSNASILYPGRMSSKDRHLLKMILVIFLSFVICYLPITVTKLWKGVTKLHFINISGYLLIYLTTCINPIIYVVMSSEYRKAYWNLLLCKTLERIPERKSHLTKLAKRMARSN